MLDKNGLIGAYTAAGYTQEQFARLVGISPRTFSRKLSKNGFYTKEASKIVEALHMDSKKAVSIFFAKEVS